MFNSRLYIQKLLCRGLLLAALSVPGAGSAQTITTIAGNGTQGFSGDGDAPTSAQLSLPAAVFGDTSGVLYLVDTGNHRIRRISAAGDTITTIAGTGTAGFSGDGEAATSARLNAPAGIYVDASGNVYLADTGNHRIRKISSSGIITTIAGRDTTAGLFIDDTTATAATLSAPSGVFVDTAGNIYIADTNNHRIRRIAAGDSSITTVAGTGDPGFAGDGDLPIQARLAFPAAVFGDSAGALYVADRFNNRVRRINPSGNITTVAGTGDFGGGGDGGAANLAQLANPSGVFLDRAGRLFIADAGNHRIRRVLPSNASGLSGAGTVPPGSEVKILAITLTGDGSTSVRSLTFTISDLSSATGLTTGDFVEFRLYESADSTFDGSDTRLGTLDADLVTLGSPTTLQTSPIPTPASGAERHYLVTALIRETATQGRAFRVGFAPGGLATSKGGKGFRVAASDADKMTIDAVATRLAFTIQPGGSISGSSLLTQPVVTAVDDSGFVDLDFADTVTVSATGPGTLLHNTAVAISGVATFTHLIYVATADDEPFALVADDQAGGGEGDLPSATSDTLKSNTVNDPPVVDFPSLVMKEDEPYAFITPIYSIVSDPDDSVFTFTFISSHIRGSVSDGQIIITPEPDWFGIDTLTVIAADPFGLQGSDQGIIEVRSVNDPPVLDLPDSLSFLEDDTLEVDLQTKVADVDDEFSDLTWVFTPSSGLSTNFSSATGLLRLWAGPDISGPFTLAVKVTDPFQLFDQDTVQVRIAAVNDLPRLSIPDTSVLQQDALVLDLKAFTTDVDHALSQMSWTASGPSHTSVTITAAGVATIRPDPAFSGRDTLVFTAADAGGGTSSDTVILDVLRVNQPPVLAAFPDTLIASGDSLVWDLASFVTDPDDPPESLIWSVSGAVQSQVSIEGSMLTLRAPQAAAYVETLQVRVIDLFGLFASGSLRVQVQLPLPLIADVPDIEFEAGKVLELFLSPYLRGDVSALSARPDTNLHLVIDPSTQLATISTIDHWKGQARIVFHASSPRGETGTDTVQVTVLNPPPAVGSLPEVFLDAGLATQVSLDAYARDDEPLSRLTWSAWPDPGLQVRIDTPLRVATITAATTAAGPLRVIFQATDAQGAAAADTMLIMVHELLPDTTESGPIDTTVTDTTILNRAPVIAAIPALSFHRDTAVQLVLDRYVQDDGPLSALAWTAAVLPDSVLQVDIDSLRVATIAALQDTGQAQILFRVTDAQGASASDTVQVTVRPPPAPPEPGDFNQDGKVDFGDFFLFADALGLTFIHPDWDPIYDLNEDGRIGFDDFFLFTDLFQEKNRYPGQH